MNRKLVLESIIFLLLGILTVDRSLACYTKLLNLSLPVSFTEKHIVINRSDNVTSVASDVLYIKFDRKNNTTQYRIFSQEEFDMLTIASKKMSPNDFDGLLDCSFAMDKSEFLRLVQHRTEEYIVIASK